MSWFVVLFVGICFAKTNCNKEMQAIYYEPASIGENPITGRIDFYTNLYANFHYNFIPLINYLGATHVIVGPIWFLCDDCHSFFLSMLKEYNLSLIITLQGSGDHNEIQVKRGDVAKILKEKSFLDVFCGFYIPQLDVGSSAASWNSYYIAFIGIVCVDPVPTCLVEFPINYNMGNIEVDAINIITSISINGPWVINAYDSISYLYYLNLYKKIFPDDKLPNYLPFVYTSNKNSSEQQLIDLKASIKAIESDATYKTAYGLAIAEFSDSWWRSSQADVSNNVTLCPNWNSYSHSNCGYSYTINNGEGSPIESIVYIEWLGIFSVSSHPLQLCLSPKNISSYIQNHWHGKKNITMTCATIDIFFWISAIIDFQIDQSYFVWYPLVLFTAPFVFFYLITILVYCFAPVPK